MAVAAGEGYAMGRSSKVAPDTLPADFFGKQQAAPPAAGARDIWAEAEAISKSAPPATSPSPPALIAPEQPKKTKPAPVLGYATVSTYEEDLYQRCAFNTGNTPCLMIDGPENDFSGKMATLKKDDRVEILSAKVRAPNGKEIYKVRFQQWTGWMDAESLALEAQ